MPNVLKTSIVYRAIAGVWQTFGRAARQVATQVQRVDAAAGRARSTPIDPDEEARVRDVLAGSRLVRLIDAAIDVPPRAWRSSALRGWLEPTAREFRSQPAAEQVRLIAWAVVVATVTHVALVVAFGEPVGWPTWATWISFLVIAGVPAFWSHGVVAAWANRRPWVRRLLREPQPWQ
ncbi:MAG: hypothetical protein HY048_16000 [Acidobacteria bacterium]|nr:hypothetical protein [Acidobacteriota bacterium]